MRPNIAETKKVSLSPDRLSEDKKIEFGRGYNQINDKTMLFEIVFLRFQFENVGRG